MKVGLISFHNAYNYGACLQAYALQEAVHRLGATCEYIDYINKRRANGYKISARVLQALKKKDIKGAIKSAVGAPFIWSRGWRFRRFYRAYLRKTSRVYRSCDEATALDSEYDRFVVGSDQVWNAEHNGTDSAYFLSFVKDRNRKISYASSFGMNSFPEELQKWYSEGLEGIGCISTRERAGVAFIQDLCGRKAHQVLDPVFLLDREDWMRFVDTARPKGVYTFYYLNSPFSIGDIERVTGIHDRLQHVLSTSVSIADFLNRNRKVTFALSPEGFLQEIHDADLVVTTSFHCLAFAIIFHKKFIAILSGDEGRDERLLNLLRITGLENRIFTRNMTSEQVEETIDYEEVESRLLPFRTYSRDFLRLSLFEGVNSVDALTEPQPKCVSSIPFTICPWDKCTGCGACFLRCPKEAITMDEDSDGFLRPTINRQTCVRCEQCVMICPANHLQTSCEHQTFYAMKQTDSVRKISSSGGAFRTLAWAMLDQGGAVSAATMDDEWNMVHTIAVDREGVERQGRTYYVQGKGYPVFATVADMLGNGRKVLFIGTPCQVSGLRAYLQKDMPNLFTCDILCHGIPSPKAFRAYINYLKSRGSLTDLKHRDKVIGWKGYCVSAIINGKTYHNSGWLKAYNVMFSHGLINRTSCFSCPYASYNRPSDITIGDWWGAERYRKKMIDRLGISLVIANTDKGRFLLQAASDQVELAELTKEETGQNSLFRPMKQPIKRLACLETVENSYPQAAKEFGEWNLKGYTKERVRRLFMKLSGF